MLAPRFFLIGYGISGMVGLSTGAHFGQLAGCLTTWLGGAALSLLIAYAWFRAKGCGISAADIVPAGLTVTPSGKALLVKIWDRELAEGIPADRQTGRTTPLGGRCSHRATRRDAPAPAAALPS